MADVWSMDCSFGSGDVKVVQLFSQKYSAVQIFWASLLTGKVMPECPYCISMKLPEVL